MGDGMKAPAQLAGQNVVGANVSRKGRQGFREAAPNDKQVFIDHCRTRQGNEARTDITPEIFAKINTAAIAEGWDRLARVGIERVDKIHYADEDATVLVVGTGPIGKAAIRLRTDNAGIEFPFLLPSRSVDRENFLRRRNAVENAIDFDGAGLKATGFTRVIKPGHLELLYVGLIDLAQGRVVSVFRIATVDGPVLFCGQLRMRGPRGHASRKAKNASYSNLFPQHRPD